MTAKWNFQMISYPTFSSHSRPMTAQGSYAQHYLGGGASGYGTAAAATGYAAGSAAGAGYGTAAAGYGYGSGGYGDQYAGGLSL